MTAESTTRSTAVRQRCLRGRSRRQARWRTFLLVCRTRCGFPLTVTQTFRCLDFSVLSGRVSRLGNFAAAAGEAASGERGVLCGGAGFSWVGKGRGGVPVQLVLHGASAGSDWGGGGRSGYEGRDPAKDARRWGDSGGTGEPGVGEISSLLATDSSVSAPTSSRRRT